MKIKKDKVSLLVIILLIAVITYLFPYVHDDWAWGSSIGMDRLTSLFENYNGRWLSNILTILLTRNRVLRMVVMTSSLSLIGLSVKKILNIKSKNIFSIFVVLLCMMPITVFAQSISWTSGFTNYCLSTLFILLYIAINKDIFNNSKYSIRNRWIVPMFLLGASASLCVEHITSYNVLLALFINGYYWYKNKKISLANIAYLIGSISGAVLMGIFTLSLQNGYREIEQGSIIIRCFETYYDKLYLYLFDSNYVLNILAGVLTLFMISKSKKYHNIPKIFQYIFNIIISFIISYIVFYKLLNNSGFILGATDGINYFEGTMYIVYYLVISIMIYLSFEKKNIKFRLIFEIISIFIIAGPLLVVSPIGPRCFLPTFIFFVIFIIDLLNNVIDIKEEKAIINYFPIIILIFILMNFLQIYRVDYDRIKYIKENKDKMELVLPLVPGKEYLWYPNPANEIFEYRFKLYYGINEDVELKFIDYDEWKNNK